MTTEPQPADPFSSYESSPVDVEHLVLAVDQAADSELIDSSVFDHLRVVSFDSQYLYIVTRGEHQSNDRHEVEELPSGSQIGFRVYKIRHDGRVGRKKDDYLGGIQWGLFDEVESTAVNARKFPNHDKLYDGTMLNEILDVIAVAPKGVFDQLQGDRFDYFVDVVCHEIGHIEHRRLENYQLGEDELSAFASADKRSEFEQAIYDAPLLSEPLKQQLIAGLSRGLLGEVYAMLVDREAARRYAPERAQKEDAEFKLPESNTQLRHHESARLLVRVLEEWIPDFEQRKAFLSSAVKR